MTGPAPGDRAVIVLDDDPTGTQSSANIPVLLDPAADPGSVLDRDTVMHVLTNTRAVAAAEAVALLRDVRSRMTHACLERGLRPEFVLRGDSTLRGHVFPESDVFAEPDGILLFVPAFPEGGRSTVDGVHCLEVDGRPVPVAETEFARDPVFGYQARTLPAWVREVGGRDSVRVPLDDVRAGPEAVTRALMDAPAGVVVLPDAVTEADLRTISAGLDQARAAGRPVVLRCAATLAAIRTGRRASRPLPTPIPGYDRPRTLVVCGSHTDASSRQLTALCAELGVEARLVPTDDALEDAAATGARLAAGLRADLDGRGVAVLASERRRRSEHDRLEHGAAVMRALCAAVVGVADRVQAVISKGGITSADVALHGLGVRIANVLGPALPGVPVWELTPAGADTIGYAVVPGNVGADRTLVDVAAAFTIL